MKTNKTNRILPYRVGDRVWVHPKAKIRTMDIVSHRLTLITEPNRKLGINFYIFLYPHNVEEEEERVFIIKTDYLDKFDFTTSREKMEQLLLNDGVEKYKDIFKPEELPEKISVSNTSENFMQLLVDLPQKETTIGIMSDEERQKAERAAKHPKNIKEQAEVNAEETIPTTVSENEVTAEITNEPELTVNKGE